MHNHQEEPYANAMYMGGKTNYHDDKQDHCQQYHIGSLNGGLV
jgi:hypothetical protein